MYHLDIRIIAICYEFKKLTVIDGVINRQLSVLLSYLPRFLFQVMDRFFLV